MKFKLLKNYLSEGALPFVLHWLEGENIHIKIKNSRRTKLGDYKYDSLRKLHQITIDRELAPDAFFFVLTHEIAHLKVNQEFGRRVKSHGVEWKFTFGEMLVESLEIYPEKLKP